MWQNIMKSTDNKTSSNIYIYIYISYFIDDPKNGCTPLIDFVKLLFVCFYFILLLFNLFTFFNNIDCPFDH